MNEDKLIASEGIFGFAAWLTCRKKAITLSSTNDCSEIAKLVELFCYENELESPRSGWENNLKHPSVE